MALSKKQYSEMRNHLDNCNNPLFFFDDDQDGLCSFLLLYRYKKQGHGVIVKTSSGITELFTRKVQEYNPDKIFIMDIADVEQEFFDEMKVPVVWIDHHGPYERKNVKYYNPRVSNKKHNQPTSFLCYKTVEQDLWIAALGCVADWFLPPFLKEFKKEYPDLIEGKNKSPGDIIYNTKLGHLIRIFSFVLKGKHSDVMNCIKILTRIKDPHELLEAKTEQARFIYKKYETAMGMYKPLLDDMMEKLEKSSENLEVFSYGHDSTSMTSDLSNEAIHRHPDKIIIIAREKNEQMKCSLRSSKTNLKPLVEKALIGLNGYGGGHENACGANVSKNDFEEFVRRLREMV